MLRLTRIISAITFACLLVLNLVSGATAVAAHCSSSVCSSGPMDMDHCDGLLNFAFPMQGCFGECNDVFCDLMKNPLQDVKAANSSSLQGSYCPFLLGTVDPNGESSFQFGLPPTRYLFPAALAWSQIPLYIENLSLII